MGPTRVLLEILSSAMSIWNSKEKTKYIDDKIKLEKAFYAEYNKDLSIRSDAVLDNIQHELCILCRNASAAIRATNTANE